MTSRKLSLIAGISYFIIFFAAIFANFFVLDSIIQNPLETVQNHAMMVRFGIMAFMITVVFDVVVAWALKALEPQHPLTELSTYFRLLHAVIFGVAIFALPLLLTETTTAGILGNVALFNTIWLIGLFFFGIHLILLSRIVKAPKFITLFLMMAGVMYMVDTTAHFLIPTYNAYADLFLALVAIPSIFGEMALSIWLVSSSGKA